MDAIVACGGLPDRNPLLMQIFADVTGRAIALAGSLQVPALGAAMFGAVAAGSGGRVRLDRRGVPADGTSERRELHAAGRLP